MMKKEERMGKNKTERCILMIQEIHRTENKTLVPVTWSPLY